MTMKQLKPATMDSLCRVVMLGQSAVGKSALVVRFLTRRFIWEYDPTLECTYKHITVIDDESVPVEILDTAGQGNSLHSDSQIRWGDGFVLVYSVDNRHSFDEISRIKATLDEIKRPSNATCVLVGNKCDLHCTRTVSVSEGEKLAVEMGCAYFETSACDDEGEISEAFGELFRELKRRRNPDVKTRRRSSGMQMRSVLSKVFTKIQTG